MTERHRSSPYDCRNQATRRTPKALNKNAGMSDEHGQSIAIVDLMRWVLLPICCITSWYVALFTGIALFSIAHSLCPDDQMVSGQCQAAWWEPVAASILYFSSGLSAFLVVVTAFLVAPAARVAVAWVAFWIGVMIALYIATIGVPVWGAFTSATIAGFVTGLVLTRFTNRTGAIAPHPPATKTTTP